MFIAIKVIPNSSQNKICGYHDHLLKVQLKGIPEKGKLNLELVDLLAKEFEIPKSSIIIKQGFTSPIKRLEISSQYALQVEIYLNRFKPAENLDED